MLPSIQILKSELQYRSNQTSFACINKEIKFPRNAAKLTLCNVIADWKETSQRIRKMYEDENERREPSSSQDVSSGDEDSSNESGDEDKAENVTKGTANNRTTEDPVTKNTTNNGTAEAPGRPGDFPRLINALCHPNVIKHIKNLGTHTSRRTKDNAITAEGSAFIILHEYFHKSGDIHISTNQCDEEAATDLDPDDYSPKSIFKLKTMYSALKSQYRQIKDGVMLSGHHRTFRECAEGNPKLVYFHCILQNYPQLATSVTLELPEELQTDSGRKQLGTEQARKDRANANRRIKKGKENDKNRSLATIANSMSSRNKSVSGLVNGKVIRDECAFQGELLMKKIDLKSQIKKRRKELEEENEESSYPDITESQDSLMAGLSSHYDGLSTQLEASKIRQELAQKQYVAFFENPSTTKVSRKKKKSRKSKNTAAAARTEE